MYEIFYEKIFECVNEILIRDFENEQNSFDS